jgi:signal peptide peptidase SppA
MFNTPAGRPGQFFGLLAIEQSAYDNLCALAEMIVSSGQYEIVARESERKAQEEAKQEPYTIENGVAKLSINGPMVRHPSSMGSAFGECATSTFQRAITKARNDGFVSAAFVEVNSPGGTTEGLNDTARALAQFRSVKPLRIHYSGIGASAAYRLGVESDVLTADPMAIVGSVGTLTRMRDLSKLAERMGIKEHYIASGDRKAAGAPGTEVTEQQLADRKALVDAVNESFLSSVKGRRPISDEHMQDVARAGLYDARKAAGIGLIDAVMTTDEAFEQFVSRIPFGSGRTLPGKVPSPV